MTQALCGGIRTNLGGGAQPLYPRKSATTAREGVRTTVASKSTVTMAQMIGEACKGSVKEGRLS